MTIKVARKFYISCFHLGLLKQSSGYCPGHIHTLSVDPVPSWCNGDTIDWEILAYCTVKTAVTPSWQELENTVKSQQAQYIPDANDFKGSKSKSNDRGSSICSGLLMAGESSSHCNFFTESIDLSCSREMVFTCLGLLWRCKCASLFNEERKQALLFSFKDKTQEEMHYHFCETILNKCTFSSVW